MRKASRAVPPRFTGGPVQLCDQLCRGCHGDVDDVHAAQLFTVPAVICGSCAVGIKDGPGFALDQQHDALIVLEDAAVARFTVTCGKFAEFALRDIFVRYHQPRQGSTRHARDADGKPALLEGTVAGIFNLHLLGLACQHRPHAV